MLEQIQNKTVQRAFVRSHQQQSRYGALSHWRQLPNPRHAASCLGGARLPTWRLPGNSRRAHWTFV